jgi:hypothetical protein
LACTAAAAAICYGQQPAARAPDPARRFHVSRTGNDAAPGSAEAPFATLERARAAVRALRATAPLPAGGVEVLVGAGTYEQPVPFELNAQDSGTPEAPVVFRAVPGAEVRLTGGRTVLPAAFLPVRDATVLARLDPAARERILVADLGGLGIADLGQVPDKFQGAPPGPELFFNDQRLTLARWPNQGWATVSRIVATGGIPRVGDTSEKGGIFEVADERLARWQADRGVWVHGYWCFDWYAEVIRVQSIDPATRQITLARPSLYGVKQGNPSPRRFYALNVLEELDQPGEYYIDRAAGLLYLWPPAEMAGARIVLSLLRGPVVQLKDASHVVLRGFVVEAVQGTGIEVSGGSGNRILACEVRNTRDLGISITGGQGHQVEACDVHETGTGGIALDGGDRKTLTPAGHAAVNNHIWAFSRHKLTYSNALQIGGVGNRAAHNLIHDAPHQAIGISGNDHVFEYNVIHDICTETDDCGAYYKGRNPSCRGNLVRYNYWYNIGSPMGHGNAAVYFDDGDGGDRVIGNVFFRCGEPGKGSFGTVFSHGGHDLLAENNIFIECRRALGSAPWNDKRWKDALGGGGETGWQTKLLKDVDITQPPYTTRYPELAGFMDPPPGQPRVNRAVRNLFVMVGEVSSGNWQWTPAENLVTNEDPGFVDAARGDFRLRPDAAVFAKLPGFQPVPFEKMGLVQNELRPQPPVTVWTFGAPKPAETPTKRAAGATAVAPRQGPVPVFRVARAAGPIAVDGAIAAPEWPVADAAKTMLLAGDVGGTPAPQRQSRAWLAFDQQTLYIAVDNTVHPETKFSGNQWGRDDAVEISLRVSRAGAKTPIHVLRGYGNGRLEFGTAPTAADEPATMDPGDIVFRAQAPQPGRWLAEFAIPFRMLDLDPVAAPKIAFNLTVRKALDDLWLMWEPTRGHSYDVDQAGFIDLVP